MRHLLAHLFPGRPAPAALPDGAAIAVIGGGPAGAFFAIQVLRKARRLGRRLDVVILEKRREHLADAPALCAACREGCNYCAGGISPKLADLLQAAGLEPPADIVFGRAETLTIHGDWKSTELPVPADKDMLFVFRGSRPMRRPGRYDNLDNFLLGKAVEEGARVITGEVRDLHCSPHARPIVSYQSDAPVGGGGHSGGGGGGERTATLEADFVVVAAGVNPSPGTQLAGQPLVAALSRAIPGFRPPRVRRALIGEMQADEQTLRQMRGQVHFAEYGSKDLPIEMSSLIPKGRWLTIALLGRAVDEADPAQSLTIIERFLELPHIHRLLPRGATLIPGCVCHPNMTVGMARRPYGDRIAVIGDMAVARLYKDGILSAYLTAGALADCLLDVGADRASLRRGYYPAVRRLHRDNQYGAAVFLLNRFTFAHPVLSRIVYQAVVTEKKSKPAHRRRLADILWRIAAGDDTYRRILLSMFHPVAVWSVLVGGVLITLRNYLTERLFGLNWTGFGRHPTGVPREDVERKRREFAEAPGIQSYGRPLLSRFVRRFSDAVRERLRRRRRRSLPRAPEFERMYTIKVMAEPVEILRELSKYGDSRRTYLRPRLIRVHRTAGDPNALGSVIQYDVLGGWLSFRIVLEQIIGAHSLVYRVQNGFARGGILVFDIEDKEPGVCLLSIYVAFDFPRSRNPLRWLGWRVFRLLFPAFVHDVLWNHGLCELKHSVETGQGGAAAPVQA